VQAAEAAGKTIYFGDSSHLITDSKGIPGLGFIWHINYRCAALHGKEQFLICGGLKQ
jgi:hypothetical protein